MLLLILSTIGNFYCAVAFGALRGRAGALVGHGEQ